MRAASSFPSPPAVQSSSENRQSSIVNRTLGLLEEDLWGGAHAVAEADGGAEAGEGALQGADHRHDVRPVHVAHVGDAEDLALEPVLPSGDGDAVVRAEALDDGGGGDAGGGGGGGGGPGGAPRRTHPPH